jgi:hypothetical protein
MRCDLRSYVLATGVHRLVDTMLLFPHFRGHITLPVAASATRSLINFLPLFHSLVIVSAVRLRSPYYLFDFIYAEFLSCLFRLSVFTQSAAANTAYVCVRSTHFGIRYVCPLDVYRQPIYLLRALTKSDFSLYYGHSAPASCNRQFSFSNIVFVKNMFAGILFSPSFPFNS